MKFLSIILVLFVSVNGWTQELRVTTSRDTILIGEEVEIKYRIITKPGDSIQKLNTDDLKVQIGLPDNSINKTGGELELIGDFFDTSYVKEGKLFWENSFKATIYDSGIVYLNNRAVAINDSMYFFPEIQLSVFLVDQIDSLDLYDINESYANLPAEPNRVIELLKGWWWLFVLIIGVPIFLILNKRKTKFKIPEKQTSLRERTLQAIDALEDSKMWEKGQLKTYFVELSFILRSYLAARYKIDLLESTTTQTKLRLKEKGLNDDTISTIIRILSQSDMVKFAKSQPDTKDILKLTGLVRQIIAETSPLDFEKIDD